jgi:hypothetical protein
MWGDTWSSYTGGGRTQWNGPLSFILPQMELQMIYDQMQYGLDFGPAPPAVPLADWWKVEVYQDPYWRLVRMWTNAQVRIEPYLCPSTNAYSSTNCFALLNQRRDTRFLWLEGAYFANNSTLGRTNYIGVSGYFGNVGGVELYEGVFANRSKNTIANMQVDGSSNTLMFGEAVGHRPRGQGLQFVYSWIGAGCLPSAWGIGNSPGVIPPPGDDKVWYKFSSEHPSVVQFVMGDGSVKQIGHNIDFNLYRLTLSGMREGRVGSVE